MELARLVFTNELGNEITMAMTATPAAITLQATGPTSELNHTWTPVEAARLRDMLNRLDLDKYPAVRSMRPSW